MGIFHTNFSNKDEYKMDFRYYLFYIQIFDVASSIAIAM